MKAALLWLKERWLVLIVGLLGIFVVLLHTSKGRTAKQADDSVDTKPALEQIRDKVESRAVDARIEREIEKAKDDILREELKEILHEQQKDERQKKLADWLSKNI
jgi:phage shock protein A